MSWRKRLMLSMSVQQTTRQSIDHVLWLALGTESEFVELWFTISLFVQVQHLLYMYAGLRLLLFELQSNSCFTLPCDTWFAAHLCWSHLSWPSQLMSLYTAYTFALSSRSCSALIVCVVVPQLCTRVTCMWRVSAQNNLCTIDIGVQLDITLQSRFHVWNQCWLLFGARSWVTNC